MTILTSSEITTSFSRDRLWRVSHLREKLGHDSLHNSGGMFFSLIGASLLVLAAAIYAARVFLDSEVLGQFRDIKGVPFGNRIDTNRAPGGRRFAVVSLGIMAMSAVFFVQAALGFAGVYGQERGSASVATVAATLGFLLGAVYLLLAFLSVRLKDRLSLPPSFFTFSREPVPIFTPSGVALFAFVAVLSGAICSAVGALASLSAQ